MADENDSSIFNLIINSDPEDAERLFAMLNQLTQSGMSAAEAFEKINAEAQTASVSLTQLTEASTQAGEAITQAFEEAVEGGATPYIDKLGEMAIQTRNVNELIAQMREEINAIPEPSFGDMGLPEPGGGGGSLFGVGHAFSVAGHSLGVPALREAGGFIYIEEGLKRVTPLMQQFGDTIAESSPTLTSLVAEFTGLSTPMAGLLAIAAPLVLAVGGLVIGMQLYNNAIAEASGLLSGLIKGQDEYYKFIETATTEEAKTKVQSLTDSNAETKRKLDENVGIIKSYLQQTGAPLPEGEGTEFLKNYVENLGGPAAYDPQPIKDAFDAAQKYGEEIDKNNIFIGRLTGDIKDNSLAANDAAEATKKTTQAAIDKATTDAALQRQLAADMNLAPDAAKKRLEALQQEGPIIQQQMAALLPYISTNEEARKQYEALNNQLQSNVAEIQFLTYTAIPAAQATKDFADSIKSADAALKAANQAHDTYVKAVASADAQLATQKEDAAIKEMQQEQALTQGSIQDSYQRSQIALAESRKETTLAQDTANAIADVRTKLGQKEIADLTDYNRKLFDDQTKYQQDAQKDQTGAYRQERDNLQTHLEKLADIQAKEANDQQDALLNRNFLALAKQQQGHSNEIDAENTAYARKQAAVQQHLQDELADLATHQAEVRTQQFVEYQRKLADDRLHAQQEIDQKNVEESRKLAVLRQSEQQQLADLTTTETYKLALLRQGFAQEIAMYELQNQRRIQAAQLAEQEFWATSFRNNPVGTTAAATGQSLNDLYGTASGFVNLLFGNNKKTRDSGGSFGAGEAFSKGAIPEKFDFGNAGSYMIPGAAMVMPLQGGNATPGGGGGNTISITIPISGGGDVPGRASQLVYQRLKEIFADG